MERNLCQCKMRYYAWTLFLVKPDLAHLKSSLILDILPEPNSVNLEIKAKKIL